MGAGILPTSIHRGKLYFLFGKENKYADTPGFSDIGGGQDGNETFLQCAIREGTEELTGFLGSTGELSNLLKRCGTYNIDFNDNKYRMHIFPMKYDHALPHYFNNNSQFLQTKLDPKIIKESKIFEKSEIKWICIDDLRKMRSQFRSYFQNTLDIIYDQRNEIYRFISKSQLYKHSRSSRSSRSSSYIRNKTRRNIRNIKN
jgi:8-oxo-dGTP pyrophosphatase MutT (NUDIX family)